MKTRTVLLVDDSRVARMMTRAIIERSHPGWTVIEAADGEQALEAARTGRPDFVVVDVNMPGIGGMEAARRLRAMLPDSAITLLTANIQEPVRQQAAALGIGFLSKPTDEAAMRVFLSGAAPL